ncbi:MAG TPA: serine/threonine-protein kinase, partial [Gemmataceae bacterium]|nr:serine/threonine-protein kinase [Gemmataceae bacterium]
MDDNEASTSEPLTACPTPPPDLSPTEAREIDRACDRFEAAWKAGGQPDLVEFLGPASGPVRSALLRQLLLLDWEYRVRAGECPQAAEYAARFPGDSALIAAVAREADAPIDPTRQAPGGPSSTASVEGPVPTRLGEYRILSEVGRGGMGVVYRARDTRLNRVVALKMVHGEAAAPRALIRFLAEAEAVAAIKHPHVVQVYECGEANGRPFLALEYLPGGTLAERLKASGQLPPHEVAELLAKVADGVAAAHELGIVHRDLKPSNVLFDEAGSPKVTDFGLARRAAGSEVTQTGAILGTPAYMSPEQAGGRTRFVGPQSDVWSLGVILYECLAGVRPFAEESVEELLGQVTTAAFVPLRARVRRLPRDLDTVVSRCLGRDPADRYPSAKELADDLGRFVRGEPVAARPVGTAERLAKWVRRNPTRAAAWGVSGLAASLLGVLLLVAGLWRDDQQARHQAEEARDTAEAAKGDEETARREVEKLLGVESGLRGKLEDALRRERVALGDTEKAKREVAFLNYAHAVDLALR